MKITAIQKNIYTKNEKSVKVSHNPTFGYLMLDYDPKEYLENSLFDNLVGYFEKRKRAKLLEKQRLEAERIAKILEAQRLEKERIAKQLEAQRLEKERIAKQLEAQRIERERLARLAEERRIEEERRLEQERIELEALRRYQIRQARKEKIIDFFIDVKDTTYDIAESTGYYLKKGVVIAKDVVSNTVDYVIDVVEDYKWHRQQKIEAKRIAKERELQAVQMEYYQVLNTYKALIGSDYDAPSLINLETKDYRKLISDINKVVDEERLMKQLEAKFRKGKKFYLPHRPIDPFNGGKLNNIFPNINSKSYEKELIRICNLFFKNTIAMDTTAKSFNSLSTKFFQTAATSIKEIFNIGSDNKILERIPKLGIIPKALRIGQQTRLLNCVKGDYSDVTKAYIANGFIPLINKYNLQYQAIIDFTEKHSDRKKYEDLTNKYLEKIKNAKNSRCELAAKLLESYTRAGSNLSGMCKKIQDKNAVDLARKTVLTFASFL